MEARIAGKKVQLVTGDITKETTEAIVNAANSALAGGGGVDGAIHMAGGPEIMAECRRIGGCPTGSAVMTGGGNLKARFVIHAVGPVFRDGKGVDREHLKGAYRTSLQIAAERGIVSIAFPSISTGAYGYPVEQASRIALKTIIGFLKEHEEVRLVRMVLFSEKDYNVYAEALKALIR
ncbi:MAG: O-acetyl-ADP-ribose deacetylase [Deltaproteobacteria bacterium]|nr:O-acetyl-ADP-ribose deacetylase [Deltaproteobacteria bacterium]